MRCWLMTASLCGRRGTRTALRTSVQTIDPKAQFRPRTIRSERTDAPPESIIGQMLLRAAASLLLVATAAYPQLPTEPGHQVYLWREGGIVVTQEMRDAFAAVGITGVDASGKAGIEGAERSGLPFYVDQAVPPGFLSLRPEIFAAAR